MQKYGQCIFISIERELSNHFDTLDCFSGHAMWLINALSSTLKKLHNSALNKQPYLEHKVADRFLFTERLHHWKCLTCIHFNMTNKTCTLSCPPISVLWILNFPWSGSHLFIGTLTFFCLVDYQIRELWLWISLIKFCVKMMKTCLLYCFYTKVSQIVQIWLVIRF